MIDWVNQISVYERNASGNLLQRKNIDTNADVAQDYDQQGKKNSKKTFMNKIAPFVVFGGIAIIYMLIINA